MSTTRRRFSGADFAAQRAAAEAAGALTEGDTTVEVEAVVPAPPVVDVPAVEAPTPPPTVAAAPRKLNGARRKVPAVRSGAGEWPAVTPTPDHRHGLGEPRTKVTIWLADDLWDYADTIRPRWGLTNIEWTYANGDVPGSAAFLEGLLRLGIKHIDDPDLFRLTPPDRRRAGHTTEAVTIPEGAKPTAASRPDRALDGIEWTTGTGNSVKKTTRASSQLRDHAASTMLAWALTHPQWLSSYGAAPGPGSTWTGLVRLGLKHINDPELGELLPRDNRRSL